MLAIGNDELEKSQKLGDFVLCHMCGKRHAIIYGDRVMPDGTKTKDTLLACYHCGPKLYLAGIGGKDIRSRWK